MPSRPHAPILAPSLLAADHGRLAEGARLAATAGAPWLHLDIMDGHFVPNLSFGPGVVAAVRRESAAFFDVHLMLDEPHRYVEPFIRAGAQLVSVHVEPAYDIAGTLARIRALGCQNGIVFNPGTPAEAVFPFLEQVDLVLAMTVQPGFGGQSFRTDVLPKIAALAAERTRRGLAFRLEVDGGVDLANAPACAAAGADTFVCGTSFYQSPDPTAFARTIAAL